MIICVQSIQGQVELCASFPVPPMTENNKTKLIANVILHNCAQRTFSGKDLIDFLAAQASTYSGLKQTFHFLQFFAVSKSLKDFLCIHLKMQNLFLISVIHLILTGIHPRFSHANLDDPIGLF